MTNTNRTKGHNYERQLAREFRDMGWENCLTSRYESKRVDDSKVDLCFTEPFNVQAKSFYNFKSPVKILKEMPSDSNYNLVFEKIKHKGEYVCLKKEDFYEIIMMLKNNKII